MRIKLDLSRRKARRANTSPEDTVFSYYHDSYSVTLTEYEERLRTRLHQVWKLASEHCKTEAIKLHAAYCGKYARISKATASSDYEMAKRMFSGYENEKTRKRLINKLKIHIEKSTNPESEALKTRCDILTDLMNNTAFGTSLKSTMV